MSILETLLFLLGNTLFAIGVMRAMGIFFEKRRSSNWVMIALCTLAISITTIRFFLDFPLVLDLVINTTAFFILSLNYKASTTKRVAAICNIYYLVLVLDGVASPLIGLPASYLGEVYGPALGFIILGLILYLAASIFRRLFQNIRRSTIDSPVFWLPSLIMLLCTLFLIVTGAYISTEVGIFIIPILLLSSVLSFYSYNAIVATHENELKAALHSQEKEYYFAQSELMQESVNKVRSIHHDMKMHLVTVKDYLAGSKTDEAADYLDSLLSEIGESENYSDTGNVAFDSIINYKLRDATDNNVCVEVKVSIPPVLNIEVSDVVTILGNLLDNALTACAKAEDRWINLQVEENKGNLLIRIENTFDGKVKYSKGSAGDIVSRKSGDEHGFGLRNVCTSVEKYNGHMDVTHEGTVFSVGILLYAEDA